MDHRFVRLRYVVLTLAAWLLLAGAPTLAATPTAAPMNEALAPVLPEYRTEFAERLAELPRYRMDLTLDDATSTIAGSLIVDFPNQTGMTLEAVPFRLYPNAEYYGEGQTLIERALVDGIEVEPRFDLSGTVLFVDLPEPLVPEAPTTISLDFTTVAPRDASGSFGILSHDLTAQRFVLADWYPIVAGWDKTGWRLEPPTEQGDPTFSVTSLYELHLIVPATYEVIASGDETRLGDGSIRIDSGPVREFALVAAQGLETLSARAGATTVSLHIAQEHRETGQHLLRTAVAALDFYGDLLGAYPFGELDIVETDLSLAYGVSWSGIVFLDRTQIGYAPDNLSALDFTIFHELGHQWWGATVGANSNDHTFMVEGLTNATALLAQAAVQGADAAENSLFAWMVSPYLNMLAGTGDGVADVSIFDRSATAPLSTLAYGKGGLGFLAIRDQIGDTAFRAALADYAETFRLGIAEPSDLRDAFETASGQSLQELWTFWFESAATTPADIETLVPRIIGSLASSQQSAVSSQRSAVSDQRSAVSRQRAEMDHASQGPGPRTQLLAFVGVMPAR